MKPLAAPLDAAKPGPKDAPEPALAARRAQALGLPDGSPEDDALALVARLVATLAKVTGKDGEPATALAFESTPDPRRFMPVAAVQALLAERATTLATMSEERAAAKVRGCPAARPYRACHEGMGNPQAALTKPPSMPCLASVPPAFAHLTRPTHTSGAPPASVAHAVQSETAAALKRCLGLPPGALNE